MSASLINFCTELVPRKGSQVSREGVAPTVERWTPNPTVAGSNPVALTFCTHLYYISPFIISQHNNNNMELSPET